MNSGPAIFDEICSALCAARLSSRKGLGELISKGRHAGASENPSRVALKALSEIKVAAWARSKVVHSGADDPSTVLAKSTLSKTVT